MTFKFCAHGRTNDELHPEASIPNALGELEFFVHNRLHGPIRDLHVSAHSGGLQLEGFTHTYYARQLAQHTVMLATLVQIIANDIKVS